MSSLMERSAGSSSVLRNRRLESYFDSSFGESELGEETSRARLRAIEADGERFDGFVDEDSWRAMVISCVRIVTCFATMMFTTFVWALIMLLLLPWPYARIRQGNVYGHVTGRLLMWILGNPIKIEGAEFSNTRGTVGIAKKEIIWYPLFGQLYVLANHLRIDRSNPTLVIESMKEVTRAIVKKKLSLIIFPEGTRSKTGRLLPFKKGFVHIALQSKLPIVPIVLTGTHFTWRKNSLHVRPAPLTVKFLPPIRTNDWRAEKIDDYIKRVHDLYIKNLPEPQRPIMMEELDSSKTQHS